MVLPVQLMQLFKEKLNFYACTVSNFEQYTLAAFINKGYFENQIVANVVQWTFIVIGCLGCGTEVSTATVEESILIIV